MPETLCDIPCHKINQPIHYSSCVRLKSFVRRGRRHAARHGKVSLSNGRGRANHPLTEPPPFGQSVSVSLCRPQHRRGSVDVYRYRYLYFHWLTTPSPHHHCQLLYLTFARVFYQLEFEAALTSANRTWHLQQCCDVLCFAVQCGAVLKLETWVLPAILLERESPLVV